MCLKTATSNESNNLSDRTLQSQSSSSTSSSSPSSSSSSRPRSIPNFMLHHLIPTQIMKLASSPKIKAVTHMSLCMAVHFAGHEMARGPTSSMFTSKGIGFQNAAALPLGVGFVSPFSVFLLWTFSKMLSHKGPKYALVKSTLSGGSFLLFVACSLQYLTGGNFHQHHDGEAIDGGQIVFMGIDSRDMTKTLLFALFVFQSANVQFLYTQHWSFLGSVLTAEEGKAWFAPIAGIGSITSTIAASYVSVMVKKLGLIGLLCLAAITIGSSSIFAHWAYDAARKNGFEPKRDVQNKVEKYKGESSKSSQNENMLTSTMILFKRVPILRAMFFEVILSQCLSSVLNFHFMVKVKETILDDEERAGWTGSCYAWVNGISGAMQFLVLPVAMKRIDPSWLWIFMPSIMLLLTTLQLSDYDPSLKLTACTFLTMKIMEYSLRGQVSEMVFASLDYESRFIGKQKIGLFANRLGKSGTAISLFLLATYFEKDGFELNHIVVVGSNIITCLWLVATVKLTKYIEKPKVASK